MYGEYLVPDQVNVISAPDQTFHSSANVHEEMSDLKETFETAVKVESSYGTFAFSASTTVKETYNRIYKEEQTAIFTQAQVTFWQATHVADIGPDSLDKSFVNCVAKLPANYSNEYITFVETFGTHYVDKSQFGGRAQGLKEKKNHQCFFFKMVYGFVFDHLSLCGEMTTFWGGGYQRFLGKKKRN